MDLPQRQPITPTERPLRMEELAAQYDRSAETARTTDTPLRQMVEYSSGAHDAGTLAELANGGIPKTFVEPLADHLQTSRNNSVAGGGFDIFPWLRKAARARFEGLVSKEAPKVDLMLDRHNRHRLQAAALGVSAVSGNAADAAKFMGRVRVVTGQRPTAETGPAAGPSTHLRPAHVHGHRRTSLFGRLLGSNGR